ncbi:hypothetical protein [Actinomadura rifamycini]|uniref:hypothetical protein n=1 Tax=Actinomadura rifamycini TaxID=31962 RepID=UPI0003FFAB61|nr:hypothetical protein [Actinomadura rifamycini]
MIAAEGTEALVLRPRRQWAVAAPVFVALTCYAVGVIALLGPKGMMIAAPLLVCTAVLLTGRPPWARTTVDARGIAWRRGWTSGRVPWRDVAKIAIVPRGPTAGYGLVVTTRTGPRAPLPAPTFGPYASAAAMAAEVEAVLARAGAHRDGMALVPPGPWGRRAAVAGHVGFLAVWLFLCALFLYLAASGTAG